jgi:DNA (cytosine-5)-methyltransferase 1
MTKTELKKYTKKFISHVRKNYDPSKPLVFWVDLFCGAGGTSTGIHFTDVANMFVAACVNHDANAILSHALNHPNTLHFTEDIRDFEVVKKLKYFIDQLRLTFPTCTVNVWASLECTNFSKAKGGQSRDADSRSLAEHMYMYLELLNPSYFLVENVVEFLEWGPVRIKEGKKVSDDYSVLQLDKKGRYVNVPIENMKKLYFRKWRDTIMRLGFKFDNEVLNSADYDACQSRERVFVQFCRPNMQIEYPKPTNAKVVKSDQLNLFEGEKNLKPHRAVREVLDFDDEGNSIFTRKKPLVSNTLNVIKNGLIKALKENEDGFLYKYYGNGDNLNPLYLPAGTVTTKDRFGKIHLIFNQYITGSTSSVDKPIGTLTTNPKSNLVSFIMNPSYGGHTSSIDRPSPTIIARQDKAPLYLIRAIMDEYGIEDIKMRMLNIEELKQIQGFPKDYKLIGSKKEQKKYIGNAVEVNQAKALTICNYNTISNYMMLKTVA